MKSTDFRKMLVLALKLCILGLLMGALGGLLGAAFSHTLSFANSLRKSFPFIVVFLPLGGIATVLLYRVLGMREYGGTNKIIQCLKSGNEIKPDAAPLIFVSTAITHLFGGSAGKEGAAIQLGGAFASALSKVFHLKDDERTVFVMSGMSAVFAGVFGTPLTAAVFILEFKSLRKILFLAILPCLISAIVAKNVSSLLGVSAETMHINGSISFSVSTALKIFALAVSISLLGMFMCFVFNKVKIWAKKLITGAILRIIVGAVIIIALTALIGDMRYNGSGMDMAIKAVEGEAHWFDFAVKILFTAITLAAGFKGGEIVPTFCIGATFGCFIGGVIGLDYGIAAAIGLIGLFCCATNSLLSAVLLGVELFGFSLLPYFMIVCIILWLLPDNKCLFENRFFKSPIFVKLKK